MFKCVKRRDDRDNHILRGTETDTNKHVIRDLK